jgi:signal transduction histidine kinase/ligand-binding sensor domain-containing protein
MSKRLKIPALFIVIPIIIGMDMASCSNKSSTDAPPPPTEYAQPVIQPLKFSKPKKIDWDAIKAVKVKPVVTKINWDKLPETSYDTSGFKPFKYPVEETKFDYNALTEKDLDIDKLPSHPLKFETYILPPPKLIKGAKLELKNGNMFVFAFGEDQKPQGTDVGCLLTDHDGFLWIATIEGVYRYDGENLFQFLTNPKDEYTFTLSMLQDDLGNIWISHVANNVDEIIVLDVKGGTLKKTGAGPSHESSPYTRLMQDKQRRIWAISKPRGIDIIDPKTQTVKHLDESGVISGLHGSSGKMDKNGNIWISTVEGVINIIDINNKKIKYFNKANGLKTDTAAVLQCDPAGNIWIGLSNGLLVVLDIQKNSMRTIKETQSSIHYFNLSTADKQGRIWINTPNNGIEIIDLEKRAIARLEKSSGLTSESVFDERYINGQVWIATHKGLNMMGGNKTVIEHIGNDSINNLMEDKQARIWKSTYHGVDILDRKKGTSRHLGIKEGLANDDTHFVKETRGDYFISTDSGMDILDTAENTITHLRSNRPDFVTDNLGRIWYGDISDRGINIYDPKNKTIRHLGEEDLLNDDVISSISLDWQGRVWISTFSGEIKLVDPKTGSIQFLNNTRGLKISGDIGFLPDSRGYMWIYTYKGIYIADFKNRKFISYTTSQGLMNGRITSLLGHNGQIYAGTGHGITVITPPADGVSANKKWHAVSFGLTKKWIDNYEGDLITKDGLYWSGDVGINVLDLAKKDTFRSTPYITGISLYDHPIYFTDQQTFNEAFTDTIWSLNGESHYLKGQTPVNKSYSVQSGLKWDSVSSPGNMPLNLQLPYNQNFIQFHYSNFNFTPHDTAAYRYILLGVDKKWSDATSNGSTINYMNIQPGDYTFEVISRNANNVWSQPAKFSFTVNPPWSRTWWAYIIYVSSITGGIWCFVYFRSRQLVKEKRILEHKVHIRTEEVMQQKEEIEAQRDDLEKAFKELKTTQTQLIQSEKMASLGELTAGIAHEIQNPLNFINNFSDVNAELIDELKQEVTKGNLNEVIAIADDIKENELKINHHGRRADGIVKGMLEHSRSRSGQKEPTDLNVMADEYMRLSYHGLRAKDKSFNSELTTHFDPALPKIAVVQQDIGRVMLNLFNNAFYAVNQKRKTAGTDYKPEVTVTTLTGKGQVIIKIKDNGIGIPDAIKEKIMQPFFTTKPTGEGTGLGLSLTYDMVVKGHGGSININSTEGEGSEFTITLPVS